MKPDILFITVNYCCEDSLLRLLEEVENQQGVEVASIVVDNSDTWVVKALKKTTIRSVQILFPKRNLGYLGAVKFAMQQWQAQHELPVWIVVSNPDISFAHRRVFAEAIEKHSNNAPGIIAPAIISKRNKRDQNPSRVERPDRTALLRMLWILNRYWSYTLYHWCSILKRFAYGLIPFKKMNETPSSIYAPHGAFVMFHRSFFEKGGSLDGAPFLFCEEIFIAETARKLDLLVLYDPTVIVHHDEHLTTGETLFPERRLVTQYHSSLKECVEKFFNGRSICGSSISSARASNSDR